MRASLTATLAVAAEVLGLPQRDVLLQRDAHRFLEGDDARVGARGRQRRRQRQARAATQAYS